MMHRFHPSPLQFTGSSDYQLSPRKINPLDCGSHCPHSIAFGTIYQILEGYARQNRLGVSLESGRCHGGGDIFAGGADIAEGGKKEKTLLSSPLSEVPLPTCSSHIVEFSLTSVRGLLDLWLALMRRGAAK